eukprot:g33384.t1
MKQQIVCCIISMFAPKDAPCSSHFARLRKESSIKDGSVHISSAVRSQLSAMRFLPMIIGSSSTFYLEAFTELIEDEDHEGQVKVQQSMFATTNQVEAGAFSWAGWCDEGVRWRPKDASSTTATASGALHLVGKLGDFPFQLRILLLSTLKLQGCFGTPDPWTYSITPTGETLIATTPVIYLQQVHFGTDDGRFVALHQQNGTEQWIHKTGGRIRSSPTVFENILYFGSDDGYLYALNARGGKEMWRFQANGSVSSTPTIYFGSDDGFVYALRESDGLLMWRFDTSGPVRTTAAVDHDLVLVGSGSGKFYGIQERGGVEVWHFDAKAAIYTSAAVHRGRRDGRRPRSMQGSSTLALKRGGQARNVRSSAEFADSA